MKLREAKTKALQLINEYSNNGNIISVTTDADYLKRMNTLANDTQTELSEKVGIDASQEYNQTEDLTATGFNKYALPSDFKEPRFVRLDDEPFYDYRIENGNFMVRKRFGGMFALSFYKYPAEITDTTSDDYVFEIDRNAVMLIPYYLGGMVIADENPAISDKLLNIYYERLDKLNKKNDQSPKTVANSMGW